MCSHLVLHSIHSSLVISDLLGILQKISNPLESPFLKGTPTPPLIVYMWRGLNPYC